MGKVTARIKVTNWLDSEMQTMGARKEAPRTVETDALVDTGAVKFYLKKSVIQQLGLHPIGEIKTRTIEPRTVFSPVALEIQGRTGRFDVVEVPDSLPNIVGQIPLEDLVCSPRAFPPNASGLLYPGQEP